MERGMKHNQVDYLWNTFGKTLLPILAIGMPHCRTCTVVSTADCIFSNEHTADTDWNQYIKIQIPLIHIVLMLNYTYTVLLVFYFCWGSNLTYDCPVLLPIKL